METIRPRLQVRRSVALAAIMALAAFNINPTKLAVDAYRNPGRMRGGKHRGRNPGAFGGPNRRKAHRLHYPPLNPL